MTRWSYLRNVYFLPFPSPRPTQLSPRGTRSLRIFWKSKPQRRELAKIQLTTRPRPRSHYCLDCSLRTCATRFWAVVLITNVSEVAFFIVSIWQRRLQLALIWEPPTLVSGSSNMARCVFNCLTWNDFLLKHDYHLLGGDHRQRPG